MPPRSETDPGSGPVVPLLSPAESGQICILTFQRGCVGSRTAAFSSNTPPKTSWRSCCGLTGQIWRRPQLPREHGLAARAPCSAERALLLYGSDRLVTKLTPYPACTIARVTRMELMINTELSCTAHMYSEHIAHWSAGFGMDSIMELMIRMTGHNSTHPRVVGLSTTQHAHAG